MNENRKQILEMLAAGKVTTDEAERLLAALDGPAAEAAGADGAAKPKPKYIRITVDEQKQGKAPTKVNVRVPMQLLRSGVKLAGLIPAQARDHFEEAMRQKGIPLDLSQVKPENLEELVDQLQDVQIDVNNDEAKVRVFVE